MWLMFAMGRERSVITQANRSPIRPTGGEA
jgi:hypothetical protein